MKIKNRIWEVTERDRVLAAHDPRQLALSLVTEVQPREMEPKSEPKGEAENV